MRRASRRALSAALALAAGLGLLWFAPPLIRLAGPTLAPHAVFTLGEAGRCVAITIDDGPDPLTTPGILDVLAANEARATFFLVGARADAHPALLGRMVAEGHELANHGYLETPLALLEESAMARSIGATHAVLAVHGAVRWLRPGSAFYGETILALARRRDYRIALADVFPYDTLVPWSAFAARYIGAHAAPGSIIVLHDVGDRGRRTARTLARVLPRLAAAGYCFDTLSALTAGHAAGRIVRGK